MAYTRAGMLKRIYPANYRKAPLPDAGTDWAESPRWLFETNTDETLLIFTDKGNCFPLPVASLTECKPKDRGQLLTGVLAGLDDDEKPLLITCGKTAELAGKPDFLFVTRRGVIKRTAAGDYDVRSKKFAALGVKEDDQLLQVFRADTRDDILMVSAQGMCIRFPLDSVPVQGRTSGGVRGIGLAEDDSLLFACQLGEKDEAVMCSDRGSMKRVPAMDFEPQGRGGKGVKAFAFNKNGSNGKLIAGVCVTSEEDDSDLLVMQVQSPVTRLSRREIILQRKQDRGMPYVMAILDDVVTGIQLVAKPAPQNAPGGN